VHINLKGREPQGIVEPGAEYERVRAALIHDLRALKFPDGSPLVQDVWKKEEVYHGEHLADAPDILFFPEGLETIAFGDFEFGSNKLLEPSYGVSSSHRMNGILIGHGNSVRAHAQIADADLTDLAPTILHLLGLPVPHDMDGRVLTEMLSDAREVAYGGSAESDRRRDEAYSREEEEQVVERLKELGYLS
jgi:predicted AlkP superfamily phosphohydrolase/phosphomutase